MKAFLTKIIPIFLLMTLLPSVNADDHENEIVISALEYYLIENQDALIAKHQELSNLLKEQDQKQLQLEIMSSKKIKKKYSQLCTESTESILDEGEIESELYAILSACFGLSAEANLFRAASHGTKSGKMIEKALELDSNNSFNNMVKGIGDYTRPAFAGGNKSRAITYLKKAIDLAKSNNDRQSSLLTAIASFHLANIAFQQREFDTSSKYLDRSLEIAPTYKKAKNLKAKLSRN
jgi:tetratricopeptide (TPR) repeat protein